MVRRDDDRYVESDLTAEERERIRAEERARVLEEERDRTAADERTERERQLEEHPDRRDHRPPHTRVTGVERVRGGVSFGSVLTGMAVAIGAMFLLTALIGGIAVALGVAGEMQPTPTQLGWGLGIALVIAQFIAYMWGGYSAGRMARGAGVLNGLLVPVVALLLMGLVAAIVAAFGVEARFVAPFTALQIPVEQDFVVTFGIGLGIAILVAMFLGAILGGFMGSRWHDKLEATAVDERDVPGAA